MKKIGQNESMEMRQVTKRSFVRLHLFFFVLIALGITSTLHAQDDEIKIATELATFEISVTDKNGVPVKGLTENDFRLFENGEERPIEFFQPIRKKDVNRPLAVVFALDVSGSMTEPELQRLRGAMQKFVDRLADYESVFSIMTFAMNVRTNQGFTNRPEKLSAAFENLRRDQDGLSTHAYDAIDQAIRQIAKKTPKAIRQRVPRRAVIVITDGFPVGDVVSPATVIERANEAQTSVFSLLLPSYSRFQTGSKRVLTPLEASGISERTGGLNMAVNDSNFEKIFEALAEQITSSYAVAFYPREESSGRSNGKVRIESRSGLLVRQNREKVFPN